VLGAFPWVQIFTTVNRRRPRDRAIFSEHSDLLHAVANRVRMSGFLQDTGEILSHACDSFSSEEFDLCHYIVYHIC